MLNTLRLIDGVPTHAFHEKTGLQLAHINPMLEAAVKKGLLDTDPRTLKATPLGMQYLNDLQMLFLK
jgi:oxygen-independent coproporphyrinogen-3 oxidase